MEKRKAASTFQEYPNFEQPICDLLSDEGAKLLTDNASKLVKGDLLAISWRQHTTRTEALSLRDVASIEDAFATHPLRGSANSELVGAACCCSCCPCCCTAVAVVDVAA